MLPGYGPAPSFHELQSQDHALSVTCLEALLREPCQRFHRRTLSRPSVCGKLHILAGCLRPRSRCEVRTVLWHRGRCPSCRASSFALSPGRFHVWLDCTQQTTNYYSLAACTAALGSEMAQLLSVICPSVEHGCAVPSLLRSTVSHPRAACLRRPTISAWALHQPGPGSPFLVSSNNNRSNALSGSWSCGVSLLPRPHPALNRWSMNGPNTEAAACQC